MSDSYLAHHGILGMHWGVRRYEDASGHLTAAGKKRYEKYNDGRYDDNQSSNSKTNQHGSQRNQTNKNDTITIPYKRGVKLKKKNIRDFSTAGKVALGVGAAALLYGAASSAKNKGAINFERKRLESEYGSQLEGLSDKQRKNLIESLAKERVGDIQRKSRYSQAQNFIEKHFKTKVNDAASRIEDLKNNDKVINKKNIRDKVSQFIKKGSNKSDSTDIQKVEPKPITTKTSKLAKNKNSSLVNETATKSKAVVTRTNVEKPKRASSAVTDIRNANRKASSNRTTKPKVVVTRTESKENKVPKRPSSAVTDIRNANRKASSNRSTKSNVSKPADISTKKSRSRKNLFKFKKKEPKPRKPRDPIATAQKAVKAYNTINAFKNRDYATGMYNIATEVIDATDRRVAEAKKKRSKSK